MKDIETGLHSLHSQARETTAMDCSNDNSDNVTSETAEPFAKVLVVVSGSPADKAGIKQGDLMSRFGSVDKKNFSQLKNISDVAESSRNRVVEVLVVRGGDQKKLKLTPSTWSGAGLIGFKIRPISETEETVDR